MNYFLLLVILGVSGAAYYMYSQDQEKIADLQQQITDTKNGPATSTSHEGGNTASAPSTAPHGTASSASATPVHVVPTDPSKPKAPWAKATDSNYLYVPATPDGQDLNKAPVNLITSPSAQSDTSGIAVNQPGTGHSSAIDSAAQAAAAASNASSLGTITTLNGHTYTNCKVLKVEQDGVTFSHDDGITKILYPLMPPSLQKVFGYDSQKAVSQTEAQIHYDQQQTTLTNAAPANP